MQIIELYILDTRVDLFEDESISITDTIQNVKDISKIFTPFSQQFNLPASKTNNKLFKHYYNFEIDGSFDARYKANAEIKLNGVTYKVGKIRLNSVSLKNNAPNSYKVVFFSDTIELKEVLAEDLLSDLTYDDAMSFTYDNDNIYSRFTTLNGDVVVPLITHSARFQMHSNGKYEDLNNNKLTYLDLKPAVKVKKVIEAIETSYPEIEFSSNFFNSNDFNNIYLWLHRNKGYISNATEGGSIFTITNRLHLTTTPSPTWSLSTGTEQRPLIGGNNIGGGTSTAVEQRYLFSYTLTTSSTDPYTVIIGDAGQYINETLENGGNFSGTFNISVGNIFGFTPNPLNIPFTVSSTNTFTMVQGLTVSLQQRDGFWAGTPWTTVSTGVYTANTNAITNTFRVGDNMPKMKVFDFLINLFKMFNLTVYKDNGVLQVETLNDFYNAGKRYDITKYVDMSKSDVGKLLQYKNMSFNFKSKETQLIQFSEELQGYPFSEESYGNDQYDGGDYKVEVDFEKMMYERLYLNPPNGTTLTNVCQGSMLDKDNNPTIGKPLLLYIKNTNDPDGRIVWHELPGGGNTPLTNYKRPSQIFDNTSGDTSLNFGEERDEFFHEIVGQNLFSKYYLDYIQSIFDVKGRKLKVSAYLPLHILLKYKLNDRFIISGKSYRINSIKTNLLTNKSDLELINDLFSVSQLESGTNPNAPRLAAPTVDVVSTTFITLSWTAISGVVGYKIYIDDVYITTITGTTHKFTPLLSGITYKLGVQASYTNFDAEITNTFETTL
jgi:hypothetical protein